MRGATSTLRHTPEWNLWAAEHTPLIWPHGDGMLIEYSGTLDQPEWPTEQTIEAARHLPGRHPGGIVHGGWLTPAEYRPNSKRTGRLEA